MNAPFEIDEETQLRMMKHSAEVVQLFANLGNVSRPPRSTISDEQYNTEIALMQKLRDAKAAFLAACDEINENSGFRTINITALSNGLDDELPDLMGWDEAVSNARRGYIGSGLK